MMANYPFDYEKEVGAAERTARGANFRTPITPRENDILAASHKDPAWLGQELNHVFPREIKDNVARGFVMDGRPFEGEMGGPDSFGVEWVYVPVARGSMEKPGVRLVKEIENWEADVVFPDPDQWDWAVIEENSRKVIRPDLITSTMVYTGFFERLISFIGFEDAAVALIDEDQKEAVHRLFDRLCIYYDRLFDRMKKHMGMEYIVFHDDWGAQRSPFFSEQVCREMLLPYLKRVVESAHSRNIFLNFHCCGRVEEFVPLMIEAGADAWDGQPLNDIWGLYAKYGDRLTMTLNEKVLDVSKEEAERWVDNIIAHLEKGKQLIVSRRCMNETAREIMYVKSREFYGREE